METIKLKPHELGRTFGPADLDWREPDGPHANVNEAVRLLGAYTARQFDIWMLAGPAKASVRAHIMSALVGNRVPQSKSGVNALRDTFYTIAKPAGDCPAVREDSFIAWCRAKAESARA